MLDGLLDRGVQYRDIGERAGVTTPVSDRRCRSASPRLKAAIESLWRERQHDPSRDDVAALLGALVERGWSLPRIAQCAGVQRSTVRAWLDGARMADPAGVAAALQGLHQLPAPGGTRVSVLPLPDRLPKFPADIPCRTDPRDWTHVRAAEAESLIQECRGCRAIEQCEQIRRSIPAQDRGGMVFAGHFTPGGPR